MPIAILIAAKPAAITITGMISERVEGTIGDGGRTYFVPGNPARAAWALASPCSARGPSNLIAVG
jgi:hypothetical protein